MITAIQTPWDGFRFRSRIEARTAVVFKTLGIRFEYEKEGFVLGDDGPYLPDFWLPDHKVWYEVKGEAPTPFECGLAEHLRDHTGYPVAIQYGEIMTRLVYGYWTRWLTIGAILDSGYCGWFYCPQCNKYDLSMRLGDDEQLTTTDGKARCGVCHCSIENRIYDHPSTLAALKKARSARFEHGESPDQRAS